MKGFFKRLGDIWNIFGVTLLLFLLIEVCFRIYFLFSSTEDYRVQADSYHTESWVSAYYDEFAQCNQSHWESYVYWKRKPFQGEYINVSVEGLRETTTKSHPLSANNPPVKLFFFGGSTMWGSGVRDAYTLPSLVGSELSKSGKNPLITNFGETGYVSTQEISKLIIELKKGNVPDFAIFYDGVNDVFSSYQSGKPGIPQNENHREKEFNTLKEKKKSFLVFIQSLSTLATVKFIQQRFGPGDEIPEYDHSTPLAQLAKTTVNQYNENIRLVNALAKQYGFQAFFYWQPTIFHKRHLSDYEKTEREKVEALNTFNQEVNDQLFKDQLHYENIHFYNLSHLLAEYREPLYIDWCHLAEDGNVVISMQMFEHLDANLHTSEQEILLNE